MCDGFGIAPYTFLNCLCVQPRFIKIYGSSESVGTFVEGAALQGILQYPGYYQRMDADTIHFTYPSLSKGLLAVGSMVCFSNSQRLLRQARTPHRSINPVMAPYRYLLNPQPVISGQDALGLITIYPRPDEH